MVNKNWTFISGKYVNTEAKIIRDLLDGYDRRAFPLNHTSNPLDVSVEYYVNQIQSLVRLTSIVLTVNMSTTRFWARYLPRVRWR